MRGTTVQSPPAMQLTPPSSEAASLEGINSRATQYMNTTNDLPAVLAGNEMVPQTGRFTTKHATAATNEDIPTGAAVQTKDTKEAPLGRLLTAEEQAELAECEAAIERGVDTFLEVGLALARVRYRGLFRSTHHSFEAYVVEKWGFSRQRAHQLMEAARFHQTIAAANPKAKAIKTERATRELMRVPDDRIGEVLEVVLEEGVPTAEGITKVRKRILAEGKGPETDLKPKATTLAAAIKASGTLRDFVESADWSKVPADARDAMQGLAELIAKATQVATVAA